MKKYAVIGVIVVLILGWLIWRSQPEQVIKRRSKALIELADQVDGGIGLFDVRRLEGLIAQQFEYEVDAASPEPGTANLAEVLSGYQWMGENAKNSDFEIEEFTSLQIEGDQARVKMRVAGTLEMKDIRMMEGIHLVEFGWRKDEQGNWRLVELIWK